MANGKPGDHPRTDLTVHNLAVFGEPTDGILKKIIRLMGQHRFDDWFNSLWNKSQQEIAEAARAKLQEVETDARARGWDLDKD